MTYHEEINSAQYVIQLMEVLLLEKKVLTWLTGRGFSRDMHCANFLGLGCQRETPLPMHDMRVKLPMAKF